MRSSSRIAATLSVLALLVGACGSGDEESTTGSATTGPETTAEASAEPADAALDCALSVEQATQLSGMQIDVVDSRATGSAECQYFQGTSENSAPKFKYRFRPGELKEPDGEPLTVAGADARYKPTTGTLLVQVEPTELLDIKGYSLERENLVSIGEAIVQSGP